MNSLILVSSGEYEDYTVRGIFSSTEKANVFKNKFPDEDWNDNEIIVVDAESVTYPEGHSIYRVVIFKDGCIHNVERQLLDFYKVEEANKKRYGFWDRLYVNDKYMPHPEKILSIIVWATSKEQAVEIVKDIREQLIKTDKWGKNDKNFSMESLLKRNLIQKETLDI